MKIAREIALKLLQSKAIKLEPTSPFTWASGWKSPIYCDNRKTLSYPDIRDYIRDSFVHFIREEFPSADCIAGVATGGIAQAALVAQALNLPMVYVRSSAKAHGLENQVEGVLHPKQKLVVIEDLVSTGGSSLRAVEAIRAQGAEPIGMLAIFNYGFDLARENFETHKCRLISLSSYDEMLDVAIENDYITNEQASLLAEWRKHPETWGK